MQIIFAKAREIAHDIIAIIGALAAAQGLVFTFIAGFGIHITALDLSQKIGMAGLAATLLSKLIDSANNIFTGNQTPASGQAPVEQVLGTTPAVGGTVNPAAPFSTK